MNRMYHSRAFDVRLDMSKEAFLVRLKEWADEKNECAFGIAGEYFCLDVPTDGMNGKKIEISGSFSQSRTGIRVLGSVRPCEEKRKRGYVVKLSLILLLLGAVYLMQEVFAWPSEVMAVPVLIGAAALFAARPGDIPEIEAVAAEFEVWLCSLR